MDAKSPQDWSDDIIQDRRQAGEKQPPRLPHFRHVAENARPPEPNLNQADFIGSALWSWGYCGHRRLGPRTGNTAVRPNAES